LERTQENINDEIVEAEAPTPLGDSYMETSNNDPNLNMNELKKSDYFGSEEKLQQSTDSRKQVPKLKNPDNIF
jgi:hypothetical protein